MFHVKQKTGSQFLISEMFHVEQNDLTLNYSFDMFHVEHIRFSILEGGKTGPVSRETVPQVFS